MTDTRTRTVRWIAMIAGLLAVVLAIATPLLPVVQTTAKLNWPQGGQLSDVTAPLISQTPVTMDITVPCDVIRGMPRAGGLVLGIAPAKGKDAALNALFVNVTSSRVDITDRNVVIASVSRDRVTGAFEIVKRQNDCRLFTPPKVVPSFSKLTAG